MTEQLLSRAGTDVVSGITSDVLLDDDPPAFWVTWIAWDSDFRRELRVGDKIVAVNGDSLGRYLQPQMTAKGVGQYAEGQYWTEIGATAGQEIELSILRDDSAMTVRGRLGTDMFYYDAQGRRALGPGGPSVLSSEAFGDSWASWLEAQQGKMSYIFTRAWTQEMPTRMELATLLEVGPRIEYLVATYPGPFAQALKDDWTVAVEILNGTKADPPVDLEYRAIGERRVELAKAAAATSWAAVLEETSGEAVPPFPAVSPLARHDAVGKVVELPAIVESDIRSSFGKEFAAIGSPSDGYWFLQFDQPEFRSLYEVLYRYMGQVNPTVSQRFRVLGRITDHPEMFVVDEQSVMGLTVQPLAALAGADELFVDLRQPAPQFAGEAELSVFASVDRDDRSPTSVVAAMINAVKLGDDRTWRSLFAPWRALAGGGGRTVVDVAYATDPAMFWSDWERSRQLIMGEVYDARVSHAEKVRRVLARDTANGIPEVEQVIVWVDHFGLFDGEYRTYQNVNVHRRWPLQRLDGGPWRIITIQSL